LLALVAVLLSSCVGSEVLPGLCVRDMRITPTSMIADPITPVASRATPKIKVCTTKPAIMEVAVYTVTLTATGQKMAPPEKDPASTKAFAHITAIHPQAWRGEAANASAGSSAMGVADSTKQMTTVATIADSVWNHAETSAALREAMLQPASTTPEEAAQRLPSQTMLSVPTTASPPPGRNDGRVTSKEPKTEHATAAQCMGAEALIQQRVA